MGSTAYRVLGDVSIDEYETPIPFTEYNTFQNKLIEKYDYYAVV